MGETMYMGYYFQQVKRGEGWTVEAGNLIFLHCTKAATKSLKRQLKDNGFKDEDILISQD